MDGGKFDILDDFSSRVQSLELELRSSCYTRIRGRNSNTQLFIGFNNDLIVI